MKKLVLIALVTFSSLVFASVTNTVNIIGNTAYVTLTNDKDRDQVCKYEATWRTSLLDWKKSFGETRVIANAEKTILFVEPTGFPVQNFRFTVKSCK